MSTYETLQKLLSEEYELPSARLQLDAKLEELGLDSLDLLELMFKIEDRFGVRIKDDIPRSLVTVQDVVRYIDGLFANDAAAGSAPASSPAAAQPIADDSAAQR